ncbi:MAG: tetratricopeptide repeat protein [Candidatus Riflebacteria bacterium]|nr:tetratricopeptide repeat protein [Candidatus Riflebacteria bacterium]
MTQLVVGLGQTGNVAVMVVGAVLLLGLVVVLSRLMGVRKLLAGRDLPSAGGPGREPTTGFTKPIAGSKPAPSAPASAAAPAAEEPAAKAAPDPSMVTQYQPGTGEGIPELEEQLRQDPENPDLLDWLAFMYYSNKRYEQAIATYQQAIRLTYENEHQHYYLGNSFYQMGNQDRAIEEWDVVVSLKPDGKLAKNAEERIEKCKKGQAFSIEAGSKGTS